MRHSIQLLLYTAILNGVITVYDTAKLDEYFGYDIQTGAVTSLNKAEAAASTINTQQLDVSTLFATIEATINFLLAIVKVPLAFPEFLIQLGFPAELIAIIGTPIVLIVGIDVYSTYSGRRL